MLFIFLVFCFFFSSRRRHTRLQGDWSSDVCFPITSRSRSGYSVRGTSDDTTPTRRYWRPVLALRRTHWAERSMALRAGPLDIPDSIRARHRAERNSRVCRNNIRESKSAFPALAGKPCRHKGRYCGGGRSPAVPGLRRDSQTSIGNPTRSATRLNSSHLVISYAVFCL